MLNIFKRILVLAPHTDDGEFGSGGSIAKFIEEGKDVFYVAFSAAEDSIPCGMLKDTLREEIKKATANLGLKEDNLILFNLQRVPKYEDDTDRTA